MSVINLVGQWVEKNFEPSASKLGKYLDTIATSQTFKKMTQLQYGATF